MPYWPEQVMGMHRVLVAIAFAMVLTLGPAGANDERDCFQSQDAQRRIKGCSELIRQNPSEATAYHNRAVAFEHVSDIDSAIADYTKVIEIAPTNATAYDNRGRAFARKGDYAHAVDDETKASELLAKANAQPTAVAPKSMKTQRAPKETATKEKSSRTTGNKAEKAGASSSWWSWFWSGSAGQPSGGKAKP